jgi:cyclopropane-fatty-acyl-phospholipid synthase
MSEAKEMDIIKQILAAAGVSISGNNPWDIQVRHDGFYRRVMSEGSLGFGESYMDGWWDCECLAELFRRLIPSEPEAKLRKNLKMLLHIFQFVVLNPGRNSKAFQIGERHYDIGNDLYRCMLDKRMVYSCAYWKDAGDLDEAQEAKLDLICRKLGLRPGDRILDIGCGWGSFMRYAAEKYGVRAVGITVSGRQAELGSRMCDGLPVEIRMQDYRDVTEKFDHIVSVGMFEHVGYKNYRKYMETVHGCLKDDGLFLLHTIGNGRTQLEGDTWINKYIFPNSMIPSIKLIGAAVEGLFVIEDMHNFGTDYDRTLSEWLNNFERNWDKLKRVYDDRFYRMWNYYLQIFAGAFRARYLHVWQIVLSKKGVAGGYYSIR